MEFRDYAQDQQLIQQFLEEYFTINDDGEKTLKYVQVMERLANRDELLLVVDLDDLRKFNEGLYDAVMGNTKRYETLFHQALDQLLPKHVTREVIAKDVMDVFIEQRRFIAERNQGPNQQANQTVDNSYPPELFRRAEVSFRPANFQSIPIRQVKAEHIGKLVTVRGIVIRESDVKPRITVACYTCDQCGYETFQTVKSPEFSPLVECGSVTCKANKNFGRLTMQIRGSTFTKLQEIKLQEHSDQVPTGHIPRTITVVAFGEQTRRCSPGDHVSISGIFLTVEKTGYRLRTGGLSADTYIQAHYITRMNKTEDDELNIEAMSPEEAAEFIQDGQNFLERMSRSIAPEIYGHEHLKRALLLLLVGGVDKNPNGMRIRGNINICLMGDPGVAKSQLLGFIDRLAPRSQYTTGRGSSGVGLTAAVMKDPITGEMTLEGGALVLADEGICCIDEFDKMMDADRTAIHEVMEQQTVSIAKAGIMTTLNARVSILAAANPAYGRYNVHRSVTDNLQLPPALLSRFDLLWLIKDRPGTQKDLDLAQHVTSIHKNPDAPQTVGHEAIDMKKMRRYIELCKTKNPRIPEELTQRLVNIYLEIRDGKRSGRKDDALFTSPRSLLAIIRLSTAFARLRLADIVEAGDIDAAVDLYKYSRESIENAASGGSSVAEAVLDFLKELKRLQDTDSFQLSKFLNEASSRGFAIDEVKEALERLAHLDAIDLDAESDEIVLVG